MDVETALACGEADGLYTSLPLSHQTGYLRWIDEAKKPETRRKRIDGMVTRLKDGQRT